MELNASIGAAGVIFDSDLAKVVATTVKSAAKARLQRYVEL